MHLHPQAVPLTREQDRRDDTKFPDGIGRRNGCRRAGIGFRLPCTFHFHAWWCRWGRGSGGAKTDPRGTRRGDVPLIVWHFIACSLPIPSCAGSPVAHFARRVAAYHLFLAIDADARHRHWLLRQPLCLWTGSVQKSRSQKTVALQESVVFVHLLFAKTVGPRQEPHRPTRGGGRASRPRGEGSRTTKRLHGERYDTAWLIFAALASVCSSRVRCPQPQARLPRARQPGAGRRGLPGSWCARAGEPYDATVWHPLR